jgi:DNA mismatch repair ATPase MutL
MIINQQRAHIRILFDRYMAQIENRKNASQRMLFPDMVQFLLTVSMKLIVRTTAFEFHAKTWNILIE